MHFRAGQQVEDYCRACKTDREHTIIVVDSDGQPLRVICGYCESQHNFRGGSAFAKASADKPPLGRETSGSASADRAPVTRWSRPAPARDTLPLVTDRERSAAPIMVPDQPGVDLEMLLRRIIREETGLSPVAPAEKWRGGSLVLRPGRPGVQEKSWPIETFFHKVVMLRNRLRTLEQQVNAADLPEDQKVKLQSYITGCYGSLTSFNILFASEDDQFTGAGE